MASVSMDTNMNSPVKMSSVDTLKVKKNRTFYINELFEALDKVEDFPYTPAQMHAFLVKATKVEGSKFRNLTKSADESATHDKKPGRVSGWTLFSAGGKKSDKSAEWATFSNEQKAVWQSKADERNSSMGIEPVQPKKKSYTSLLEEWNNNHREALTKWASECEKWATEQKGPMPEKPVEPPKPEKPETKPRKKKSSDSSESSNESSNPPSPTI